MKIGVLVDLKHVQTFYMMLLICQGLQSHCCVISGELILMKV
jgi:hypothetical protein